MSTEKDYLFDYKDHAFDPGAICTVSVLLSMLGGLFALFSGILLLMDSHQSVSGWFWSHVGLSLLAGPGFINTLNLSSTALASKKMHFCMIGAVAFLATLATFELTRLAPQTAAWLLVWCWFSVIVFLPRFQDWRPSTNWLNYWVLMAIVFAAGFVLYRLHAFLPNLSAIFTGLLVGASVLLHGVAMWFLRRKDTPLSEEQNIDVWPYLMRASDSPVLDRNLDNVVFSMIVGTQIHKVQTITYCRLVANLDDDGAFATLKNRRLMNNAVFNNALSLRCAQAVHTLSLSQTLQYLNEPSYDRIKDALQERLRRVDDLSFTQAMACLKHASGDHRRVLDGFKMALQKRIETLEPRAITVFGMYDDLLAAVHAIERTLRGEAAQEELSLPNLDLVT